MQKQSFLCARRVETHRGKKGKKYLTIKKKGYNTKLREKMKLKKIDIMREWDNSDFRKEYKVRLTYKNMEECYNEKRQISGFILYKDGERFYFNTWLENKKVIIKKDIFENLAEREEFEQKRKNNDILLIF